MASEQKATRVLGLVFAVFFVCWFPFFSTNVIVAFCSLTAQSPLPFLLGPVKGGRKEVGAERCSWFDPAPGLIALFAWLGYISSVANPIIYTVFNKHFRHAFHRILKYPLHRPTFQEEGWKLGWRCQVGGRRRQGPGSELGSSRRHPSYYCPPSPSSQVPRKSSTVPPSSLPFASPFLNPTPGFSTLVESPARFSAT